MVQIIEEVHEQPQRVETFTFKALNPLFPNMAKPQMKENIFKWGLSEDMSLMKFRYEEKLNEDDIDHFLKSFFTSNEVIHSFRANTKAAAVTNPTKIEVAYEPIKTTATTLQFLRRFEEAGLISSNGHIKGRFDEDFEGIMISDLIREAIYLQESEHYELYNEAEREEFLFHIFKNMIIGGASNQYEDYADQYFEATKVLYKDLLSVQKNASGDIEIKSKVYKVTDLGDGGALFKTDHMTNYCYVIVDQMTRIVNVWYFNYVSIWG